jgi:hypothetical protein
MTTSICSLLSSGTQEHKEQEEDDELGLSSSFRAKQQEEEKLMNIFSLSSFGAQGHEE